MKKKFLIRAGKPTHLAELKHKQTSACGIPWAEYVSDDVDDVDCYRCRKTASYKIKMKEKYK